MLEVVSANIAGLGPVLCKQIMFDVSELLGSKGLKGIPTGTIEIISH